MDRFEGLLLFGTIAIVLLGAGLLGFGVYDAVTAETFSLRKDEWSCTASHLETRSTTMLVGKVIVPQVSVSTVCDRWERAR